MAKQITMRSLAEGGQLEHLHDGRVAFHPEIEERDDLRGDVVVLSSDELAGLLAYADR